MRSDILLSVGIVDEDGVGATLPRLAEVSRQLASTYRYFEVLYVVAERQRGAITAAAQRFAAIANLRIIIVADGTRFYRKRQVAAMEAIGDVVVLFDSDDMPAAALDQPVSDAKDRERVMIGWRDSPGLARLSYRLLAMLSRNHVDARAARTLVIPRERLNALLERRSAALDLRFEPRSALVPYDRFPVGKPTPGRGLEHRTELLMEILLTGAPRYLKAYAAMGFAVTIGAFAYAIYALVVVLTKAHVQEGWFSTAITQAGSTGFIAIGLSMVAVALIAILDHERGGPAHAILDEMSNTSFFAAIQDRNVEFTQDLTDPAAEPARA